MKSVEIKGMEDIERVNMVVGAVHLRKYGKFLQDYADRLSKINERLGTPEVAVLGSEIIELDYSDMGNSCVANVVQTDNKVLKKIVTVMSALCIEARDRISEAHHFYNTLLIFGEELDNGDGHALTITTKYLPELQNLANFIERCHVIVGEFCQQLAAVYTISTNNQIINAENMHFEDMMQHLGDLLVVLVTLDALVASLESLHETWALFKRLLPTVQLPEGSVDKIKTFIHIINKLEVSLLDGRIFLGAIDKLMGWKPTGSFLADELQLYVRNMLHSLENGEQGLIQDASALFLRTACVLALTALLFGLSDKKLLRLMWDVAKKYPCIPLAGPCLWNPDEFFTRNLDHILKTDDRKQAGLLATCRTELLAQKCRNTSVDLKNVSQDVCLWTIDMDAVAAHDNVNLTLDELKRRSIVFLKGAKLAGKIKRRIRLIINGHAAQLKPMTRSTVMYLCALTELLAAIRANYDGHCFELAEAVQHVAQYLAHTALTVINKAIKRLSTDKGCTKRHLDALSALLLAQKALTGPATSTRLLVVRLALSVARGAQARVIRDEEVDELYSVIQQMDQIASLQKTIRDACDVSHLYYQRVILPVYLDHGQPAKMSHVLTNLQQISAIIPPASQQQTLQQFEEHVQQELDSKALSKIREGVETSLRLQVHSHLQCDKTQADLTPIRLQPVRLFSNIVSMKSDVEAYLDKTFYNLTTVALHDWRSYGEMRALARVQLGLSLVKDCLPCQTLDQGLDILEVIRNIHVFVAGYQYNMNNQLFIERESPNKHLNTIGILHVSNSIRTHGAGIINTTVNFIYQFLRNKFYIFSQFLFDEQIKSRLAKDALTWRDAHARGEECYPYDRADKFVRGIRKLGMCDGLSFLDQFRILVTQIGNAMGYIRLVRSGGMHACSNSLSFLPETEITFADRCNELSDTTREAAHRLDSVVQALGANFEDGCNYFRMLVDVFSVDFRNPKNGHLNNFYMIVPPLTISYVDHMLANKERVSRRKGGVWTDDGFAMGLAYVLTLLDQHSQLRGLHWFESARRQHRRDPGLLPKTSPRAPGRRDDTAASLLTAKRLGAHVQEFELLAFGLNSANIFFKKQTAEVPTS